MNQIDKIISALYLAKSDNREKMLSDLILNVLYSTNEYLPIDDIVEYIKISFHFEPIKYELETTLNSLVESGEIFIANSKYCLSSNSKESIHAAIVKENDDSIKRKEKFFQIVEQIYDGSVSESEIQLVWEVYNRYLIECFFEFGRKAVNIFVPYESDTLSGDDSISLKAYKELGEDKLIGIFKKLVVEYPERLSETELKHLFSLANRAEKFYSLGVEKGEYDKIDNIQVKDMLVILDTNILYTLLNLRTHPERSAIFEILNIIKTKSIDIKLAYFPKTFSELLKVKNYLDRIISKEKFNPHHIKALLASDKLDSFARQYYTEKLSNSGFPHPSERITYAKEYLQAQGINIYNHKFIEFESEEFMNAKVAEYIDFERYFNDKNYGITLHKDFYKIEHDVCLREAVKSLKSKHNIENDLNFICITLDNSLIHFDHHQLKNENEGLVKVLNPNFILPSIFLKKIRPFIPIVTNDYAKAFVTSLTAIPIQNENEENSVLVQKSMTYFKNIGIDDEDVIIACIKRELFLTEFEEQEKENNAESFIKSEIGKEIEHLRSDKFNTEKTLEDLKEKSQKEIEQIKTSKHEFEKKKNEELEELENTIKAKEGELNGLNERLKQIENQLKRERDQSQYEKDIKEWEDQQDQYAGEKLSSLLIENQRDQKYILFVIFITVLPITIGILIKVFGDDFIRWLEAKGINQWFLWGFIALIQLFEIFGRTYIFNKEKIKNGWKVLGFVFFKKKKTEYLSKEIKRYKSEYEINNKKPKAPNIKSMREDNMDAEKQIA